MQREDKSKINQQVVVNVARATGSKDYSQMLPGDMLTDLRLAFDYYDKDRETAGLINKEHFKNILHNFGFNKLSVKDREDELKKTDPEYAKRTFVDLEFCNHVVAYRWFDGGKKKETGREQEAQEAFSLFDKNKRGYAT